MWWDFLKEILTGTLQNVSFFVYISVVALFWSAWKILGARFTKPLHWCPSPGECLVAAPSSLGVLQHSTSTLHTVLDPQDGPAEPYSWEVLSQGSQTR